MAIGEAQRDKKHFANAFFSFFQHEFCTHRYNEKIKIGNHKKPDKKLERVFIFYFF